MKKVGVLWDEEVSDQEGNPFSKDGVEEAYRFFSSEGEKADVEFYIAHYKWYKDGELEKAHFFDGENWVIVKNIQLDAVFDKFLFDDETEKLKQEISEELPLLNALGLERICKDKLLTYQEFPEHVPETREASRENVREFIEEDGRAVLKPRYDHGGRGVKVIETMSEFEESDLVQRFVDSTGGIEDLDVEGAHDLRVIVLNGEVEAVFLRLPDEGLISNLNQGGELRKVETEDLPEEVSEIVDDVDSRMKEFGERLYSVDFIFDEEERPWILELNSKPGLVFYGDDEIARWKKPVISELVQAFSDF